MIDLGLLAKSIESSAPRRHGDEGEKHVNSITTLAVCVVDVGKGDCILLQTVPITVLIDTGYESTAPDVLSHLEAMGVDHLDAMIITHYDRDHVEGMLPIGEAMDVSAIYLPGYEGSDKNYRLCVSSATTLDAPVHRVNKEFVLRMGDAQLTVFPSRVAYRPGSGKVEGNDNDMSLVATLTNGRDSYLFAGDLEEDGIAAYLARSHGRYDVLKMPHHGQHSSNTSAFLDDVRPKVAVITDAKKDPADKKTRKLLNSAGVETYRTSTDGTVVIASDGNGTYSVSFV
jgi:beta-lactamase superfamily II metal-dependent hydrolase